MSHFFEDRVSFTQRPPGRTTQRSQIEREEAETKAWGSFALKVLMLIRLGSLWLKFIRRLIKISLRCRCVFCHPKFFFHK